MKSALVMLLKRAVGRDALLRAETSFFAVLDYGYITLRHLCLPLRLPLMAYAWLENRRTLRQFGHVGRNAVVQPPDQLVGARHAVLGESTYVHAHSRWDIVPGPSCAGPVVRVGYGCNIGHYFQVSASNRVEIGDHALIASHVFVTDSNHCFQDPALPIIAQGIESRGATIIEDNCWLGQNVVVLANVRIGRHSIVGAGTVVTHDIPPFSVAVGNPARVVSRFDRKRGAWVSAVPDGGGHATAEDGSL